jgi:hypothetical protein
MSKTREGEKENWRTSRRSFEACSGSKGRERLVPCGEHVIRVWGEAQAKGKMKQTEIIGMTTTAMAHKKSASSFSSSPQHCAQKYTYKDIRPFSLSLSHTPLGPHPQIYWHLGQDLDSESSSALDLPFCHVF